MSALQQHVAHVLRSISLHTSLEVIEERTGYRIDLQLDMRQLDMCHPHDLPAYASTAPPSTLNTTANGGVGSSGSSSGSRSGSSTSSSSGSTNNRTNTDKHKRLKTSPNTHHSTTRSSNRKPLPYTRQHTQESLVGLSQRGAVEEEPGKVVPVGWLVEIDGPSHFLQDPYNRARGSTLLKRRHLQSLGYALVIIPYFEWNEQAAKGQGACQAYLQAKLALFQGQASGGGGRALFPFPLFPESMPLPTDLELRVRNRVPSSRSNL